MEDFDYCMPLENAIQALIGQSYDSFLLTILSTTMAIYYPSALRRVQITPKTSTNIRRYLYSRGPVRQVFSQRASDELD